MPSPLSIRLTVSIPYVLSSRANLFRCIRFTSLLSCKSVIAAAGCMSAMNMSASMRSPLSSIAAVICMSFSSRFSTLALTRTSPPLWRMSSASRSATCCPLPLSRYADCMKLLLICAKVYSGSRGESSILSEAPQSTFISFRSAIRSSSHCLAEMLNSGRLWAVSPMCSAISRNSVTYCLIPGASCGK